MLKPKNKTWKNMSLVDKVTWIIMWDDADQENFEAYKPVARRIISQVKRDLKKKSKVGDV